MIALVCHRQRHLVQLAKLQAERQGMKVHIAPTPGDVVVMARLLRPRLIVLGNDLASPSTDEITRELHRIPELKGVEVVVMKCILPPRSNPLDFMRRPRSNV